MFPLLFIDRKNLTSLCIPHPRVCFLAALFLSHKLRSDLQLKGCMLILHGERLLEGAHHRWEHSSAFLNSGYHHRPLTGWLKQKKPFAAQLWSLEVQEKGIDKIPLRRLLLNSQAAPFALCPAGLSSVLLASFSCKRKSY